MLDPIVGVFHLTRAPISMNSSPNLLHQDSVHQIGIDRSRIKPTKNILSRCHTRCKGQFYMPTTLEVVFGSPITMPKSQSSTSSPYTVTITYCRDKPRWLDSTRYHTMPSPRDKVTIRGKAELHPDTGKYTAVEAASCAFLSNLDSTANPTDTNKGV